MERVVGPDGMYNNKYSQVYVYRPSYRRQGPKKILNVAMAYDMALFTRRHE